MSIISFEVIAQCREDLTQFVDVAKAAQCRLVIRTGFTPNTLYLVPDPGWDGEIIYVDGHNPEDVQAAVAFEPVPVMAPITYVEARRMWDEMASAWAEWAHHGGVESAEQRAFAGALALKLGIPRQDGPGSKATWDYRDYIPESEAPQPAGQIYFGFAVADGMFPGDAVVQRQVLTLDQVRVMVEAGVTPALNPHHAATIDAMRQRYDLNVEIPESAPKITLGRGDRLIVMSVRGLQRLTDRREYTAEEVAAATFEFAIYTVLG